MYETTMTVDGAQVRSRLLEDCPFEVKIIINPDDSRVEINKVTVSDKATKQYIEGLGGDDSVKHWCNKIKKFLRNNSRYIVRELKSNDAPDNVIQCVQDELNPREPECYF